MRNLTASGARTRLCDRHNSILPPEDFLRDDSHNKPEEIVGANRDYYFDEHCGQIESLKRNFIGDDSTGSLTMICLCHLDSDRANQADVGRDKFSYGQMLNEPDRLVLERALNTTMTKEQMAFLGANLSSIKTTFNG